MKFRRLVLAAIFVWIPAIAFADWLMKDANGNFNTVFAFVCQTTKICAAEVPIDQNGNAFGVSANPFFNNLSQVGGNTVPTGVGASTNGSQRVAVARDSQIQVWDGTNPTYVTPASTIPPANQPALTITQSPNGDPCAVPTTLKSNVVINVTSAVTTQLVALLSGKVVYVCGFSVSLPTSGTTAATFQLEYGTGTTCGTGTTVMTGTFGNGYTTAGPPISYVSAPSNGTVASTPAGNALCVVTAGTTINLQGHLTYVQQ